MEAFDISPVSQPLRNCYSVQDGDSGFGPWVNQERGFDVLN